MEYSANELLCGARWKYSQPCVVVFIEMLLEAADGLRLHFKATEL